MKTKFTLLAILIASYFTGFAQQPPNGSFEVWTNGWTPTGWAGVESILSTILPIDTSYFTFKDTTTFTDGRASVMLVTDTIPGAESGLVGIQPGLVTVGTAVLDAQTLSPVFTGIPFTYRPDSIIFDYKLTSPGTDVGGFRITLSKQAVAVLSYQNELVQDTGWTHVALSLTGSYSGTAYPDSLMMQFVSSATNTPTVGTIMHLDAVRFGYVSQPLSVSANGAASLCTTSGTSSVTFQANTGGSTAYTYQWNLEGNPISGATSSSYTTTDTGTYTVVIDSASVTETSEPLVVSVDSVVATLPGFNDTVCNNSSAILLHTGSPVGGTYTIDGTAASTFTPSTSIGLNTITYSVVDQSGCNRVASATVLVENCTGINNIAEANLSVYPNPASSVLNISSNQSLADFNLTVYDVLGRVVINRYLLGDNNAVNVAQLVNGTYIYRIMNKQNEVVSISKFNVVK